MLIAQGTHTFQIAGYGFNHVHVTRNRFNNDRSHFIAHPSLVVNEFAALPSFHIGWVALACAVLMLATQRRWPRGLLIVPPILMTVAVIVTANHYVVDVAASVAISLAALAVSSVSIRANPNAERPQR